MPTQKGSLLLERGLEGKSAPRTVFNRMFKSLALQPNYLFVAGEGYMNSLVVCPTITGQQASPFC